MSTNQLLKPITVCRKNNILYIGGCNIIQLAKKYGTPLYVIDEDTIKSACQDYKNSFKDYPNIKMIYACKALCTSSIMKLLNNEGFCFDAVSIGEIYTIHKSGINLEKVFYLMEIINLLKN